MPALAVLHFLMRAKKSRSEMTLTLPAAGPPPPSPAFSFCLLRCTTLRAIAKTPFEGRGRGMGRRVPALGEGVGRVTTPVPPVVVHPHRRAHPAPDSLKNDDFVSNAP